MATLGPTIPFVQYLPSLADTMRPATAHDGGTRAGLLALVAVLLLVSLRMMGRAIRPLREVITPLASVAFAVMLIVAAFALILVLTIVSV